VYLAGDDEASFAADLILSQSAGLLGPPARDVPNLGISALEIARQVHAMTMITVHKDTFLVKALAPMADDLHSLHTSRRMTSACLEQFENLTITTPCASLGIWKRRNSKSSEVDE
jgi:hypothetical protein